MADHSTRLWCIDYAGNTGDDSGHFQDFGPTSYSESANYYDVERTAISASTGVIYPYSETAVAAIGDGTSNTILLGEKYLDPDYYETGQDPADDEGSYTGHCWDIDRWTDAPPHQDQSGIASDDYWFGSAHAGICNFAFCDGSIHSLSYSIDATIFANLGNRQDGASLDASRF